MSKKRVNKAYSIYKYIIEKPKRKNTIRVMYRLRQEDCVKRKMKELEHAV